MSDRCRTLLEGICDEFERTIAEFENIKAGRKGMQVPFFGDFASIAHMPGPIIKMRWWVREFRKALDESKSEIGKSSDGESDT